MPVCLPALTERDLRVHASSRANFRRLAVSLWLRLVLPILFLMVAAPLASGQTAHLSYVTQLVGGGFNKPIASAIDASGNIYVFDLSNDAIKKIPAGCTSSSCVVTVASSVPALGGVALDASGNLYFPVVLSVTEIPVGCTSSSCWITLDDGFSLPNAVSVDATGNVYVADWNHNAIKEVPVACRPSSCVTTLGAGFAGPTDVVVDASGNLYVADSTNNAVKMMTPNCTAANAATCVTTLGGGFNAPGGLAVDAHGNVFVADTLNHAVKEIPASCTSATCVITLATGFNNLYTVVVDSQGNLYASDWATNSVVEILPGGLNIAATPVGQTATGNPTLTFTFDTGGTIAAPVVLTEGATGLDFADAGTGSCTTNGTTHTYNAGDTCTVQLTFSPKFPGLRRGAVQLKDASGNVIATAYVSGTGTGPQVVFNPATSSNLGGGLRGPYEGAVDGSGNVYVADYDNNAVDEIPAGCTSATCVIPLGGGFSRPLGIAIDGSGNIYVAEDTGNAVKEMPAGCSSSACVTSLGGGFNEPTGVAVDGSGNVYVGDARNHAVKKMPAGCSSSACVTTLGGGFNRPFSVAVDGSGNIYIADSQDNLVKKMPAGCASAACVTTLGGGFQAPASVALDSGGNIYVADYNNSMLKQMPNGCTSASCVSVLSNAFSGPSGVTMDPNGNLYVVQEMPAAITKLDRADAPSLSFAPTAVNATSSDSPQTVTLANIGNAALTFPTPVTDMNPGITSNFSLSNSSSCPMLGSTSPAATLAAGSSCTLLVSFTPAVAGTLGGSLSVTDGHLNAAAPAYATQILSLSGVAGQLTLSPAAGALADATYNQSSYSQTFTAGGGAAPYSFSGTSLPDGLSVTSSGTTTGTLSGTPSAAGSFTFTITATDANNLTISQSYTLQVDKATPTITTVPTAADIAYGSALSASALSHGVGSVDGSFAWSTPTTVPPVGTGSYSVTFTPTDTSDYNTVTTNVSLTVDKATPTITTIPTAAGITYGAALSTSALSNAVASVSGGFAWTAPATVPSAGTASYSVTFTPDDTTDYNTTTTTASLTVAKATPTITTVPTATDIAYGSALSDSTLNQGVGSVHGGFAWTTPTTVPAIGVSSHSVTFTPDDATDYNTVTTNVNVTVVKATPTITTTPATTGITYGAALSTSTFSGGVASVIGTFAWTTPATVPAAGTAAYSVTFTPNDTTDYNTVTLNVSVTVAKATPTITTPPTAAAITYGATLSASGLANGVASVQGSFAWTAPASVPSVGAPSYSVTFTPTDTADYNNVTLNVNVPVGKATPTITTPPTAASINSGANLSASALRGGVASVQGTFSWTAPATVPPAGTSSYSVTFTPTDTTDYNTVTLSVSVVVGKTTPTVTTLPTAASITYGAPLSASALVGGVASVPGTFAWTAPATIPTGGTAAYSVTFTPTDTTKYNTFTANVSLAVNKATATISVAAFTAPFGANTGILAASIAYPGGAAPAGAVVFTVNGSSSNATCTATATARTCSVTFSLSGLAAGGYLITVAEATDTNYLAASGSGTLTITPATDFTFTTSGAAEQTVGFSSTAVYRFALAPMTLAYPGAVSFAVSGVPGGGSYTITPTAVSATGAAQTVTLTVHTPKADASNAAHPELQHGPWSRGSAVLAAMLLPLCCRRRMRQGIAGRLAAVLLCVAGLGALAGLTGCGSGYHDTSYTITVTARSGTAQHTANVTLNLAAPKN